jgi:ribosomal protein S18 acetylase RimI-like enzyme
VALAQGQLIGFVTFRTCGVGECEDKVRPQSRMLTRRAPYTKQPALTFAPPRRLSQDLLGAGVCGLSGAGRTVAYILTLGVAQEHQRRGIAAALLARVVSDCKARAAARRKQACRPRPPRGAC